MGQCWNKLRMCSGGDDQSEDENLALAGGNVILVTTLDIWEEKVTEANGEGSVVVVNFSAPWCSRCKMMAPLYRELSDKHSSIMFLTVDVNQMADLSSSWDIKATPTFYFLRNGQPLVDKLVGANKAELQKRIASIVDLTAAR